jgi:hypothetical protein
VSSTEPSEESDLNPFSTENVTEVGGMGDNESITAAFKAKSPYEVRIFNGLAQSIAVYRELLMTSVAHYHVVCFLEDPTQEDPLAEFSAVGRELANVDPTKTAAL